MSFGGAVASSITDPPLPAPEDTAAIDGAPSVLEDDGVVSPDDKPKEKDKVEIHQEEI